ncbi:MULTISPECIES: homoserine kinase [unclassified Leeuwenhoekiella]|uniref:homoserine kinase n=1 Tax=unclassified Leeuwenhoekiella TaxID=2615029 RepID=UPI000C3D6880|nr:MULTISPECIES: homoserine kinase [unclassified Leeuwenhoekiella]MAW94944.1 homoserine kinase [Leeuwenhoekiella sp.]MBA79664.1 homoserine kinase [Leeuwenhoekiella sp.]|tara:strand:+ start:44503 stop:45432 length:930 start_codon:yes stop_codon:yes gene_type:complete
MNEIRVFSPATVANVNCGFDVLGFALDGLGDEMVIRKVAEKGIKITKITGAELPYEAKENVVGVAGLAMVEALNLDFGFEIEIHKKIRLGSGVGSSAASAAGIVFGINQFLETPISNLELTAFGMKGEAVASGNEHADNVAPCLYGGFTLITGYEPLKIVSLPVPEELFVTIIHPHITIKTKEAREILPEQVSLKNAIKQTGNLAGLIAGLYEADYGLIASSTQDVLVEPHRKNLIPDFDFYKETALKNGGLAFGISGSGPSMFTLSKGLQNAGLVEFELKKALKEKNMKSESYVSRVSKHGNRILEQK